MAFFVAAGVIDVQAVCELWEDVEQLLEGELLVVWVEVDVLGPDLEDVLVVGAVAALDIGKSFKLLGMNRVSISVYEDAIDMWKSSESMEHENMVAGKVFSF